MHPEQPEPQRPDRTWLIAACIGVPLGAVVLFLVVGTLLIVTVTTRNDRGPRCSSEMRQWSMGIRVYLNNFEEYFPPAWHVGGARLSDDLSTLASYRSLLCEYTRGDFRCLVRPGGDPTGAHRRKFEEIQKLWTDPTGDGWTRDYFAPEIVFRMPDPREIVYDRHTASTQLTTEASPTVRPLLADVNASLPDPEARDPNDPEHEAEMRKGFSVVKAAGIDVFVGVGPSLRRPGDYSTSRFDFRHRGGVNVLFLDGHVEWVKADEKARLEKIHRYWNSIDPTSDKEPGK